ncbi:MAG: guanylate kinase [Nitrospinae bacterium]|nr:guanylate kinase [Nitrospinota bacterium]
MSNNEGATDKNHGAAGVLFVISAPSGAGKTTLAGMTTQNVGGIKQSVSHTTRLKRPGETEGKSYFFVDKKRFETMIKKKMFVEWVRVHNEYYGTSYETVDNIIKGGSDLLLVINVEGALALRRRFKETALIFIIPPTMAHLEERLGRRGTEVVESIRQRIIEAKREMAASVKFDYLVVNDKIEVAAREIEGIVRAERCKTWRRVKNFPEFFKKRTGKGRKK